jgi:uncharacterized membrane protein YagU involved in acid resistance
MLIIGVNNRVQKTTEQRFFFAKHDVSTSDRSLVVYVVVYAFSIPRRSFFGLVCVTTHVATFHKGRVFGILLSFLSHISIVSSMQEEI